MGWGLIRVKVAQNHEGPTGNISLSVVGNGYLETEITPRSLRGKELLMNYVNMYLKNCGTK